MKPGAYEAALGRVENTVAALLSGFERRLGAALVNPRDDQVMFHWRR
jgi:hypothetical protein